MVVEAGARSGALVTASWALEQGRECFLVPGSIDAPTSAGCNGFLRDWPGVTRVVSGVPQLLDDLGLMGAAALPGARAGQDRALEGRRHHVEGRAPLGAGSPVWARRRAADVADALLRGAVTVDELVAVTRLSVGGARCADEAGGERARHGRPRPV